MAKDEEGKCDFFIWVIIDVWNNGIVWLKFFENKNDYSIAFTYFAI